MAELELVSVRCLTTADLLSRDGVRLRVAGDDEDGIELSRSLEEGYARRLGERVAFRDRVMIELAGPSGDEDEGWPRSTVRRVDGRGLAVDRLVLLPEALAELPAGAHSRVARFRCGSSSYRLDIVLHVRPSDLQRWTFRGRPHLPAGAHAAT